MENLDPGLNPSSSFQKIRLKKYIFSCKIRMIEHSHAALLVCLSTTHPMILRAAGDADFAYQRHLANPLAPI